MLSLDALETRICSLMKASEAQLLLPAPNFISLQQSLKQGKMILGQMECAAQTQSARQRAKTKQRLTQLSVQLENLETKVTNLVDSKRDSYFDDLNFSDDSADEESGQLLKTLKRQEAEIDRSLKLGYQTTALAQKALDKLRQQRGSIESIRDTFSQIGSDILMSNRYTKQLATNKMHQMMILTTLVILVGLTDLLVLFYRVHRYLNC